MDGPMLTSYIQEWMPPATWYAQRTGTWVGDPVWPTPHTHPWQHALGVNPQVVTIGSDLRSGSDAGMWCSYALPGDYAADQRGEDGRAWYVDLPVTPTPQSILGFPEVTLRLASDQPTALVACAVVRCVPRRIVVASGTWSAQSDPSPRTRRRATTRARPFRNRYFPTEMQLGIVWPSGIAGALQ